MHVVEFRAKIKDDMIELPRSLKETVTGSVKVMILQDDPSPLPTNPCPDAIDRLLASPLQIHGFHPLNRDEIHAR